MNNFIDVEDFLKVSIHTGTVLSAALNPKARKPAFVMEVDFGAEIGHKITSAQITENYQSDELIGRQVIAITNFPPLRVAGIKSEVLVLGVLAPGGVVLLQPDREVGNGQRIA
jgi:tRNA-binding protein